MFWVLIFSLFSGGSQSAMLDTSAKRYAKKFIVNKESRAEIIDILNTNREDQKAFTSGKSWVTELKTLNASRATTPDQFNDLFTRYMGARKEWDKKTITNGIKIRKLITEPEWEQIVMAAAGTFDAQKQARERYKEKLEKFHDKIDAEIGKVISNDARFSEIMEVVYALEETMIGINEENNRFNHRDNKTLRNKDSSFDDFLALQEEKNVLLRRLFDSFITTHGKLTELTTEEEWPPVSKSMIKIFGV